jgi:hypothetical protein
MAEGKRRPGGKKSAGKESGPSEAEAPDRAAERATADESERQLGRYFAIGLPLGAIVGALAVGAFAGLGPALLVLAAGALLGTIGLFWASLRTLSGDAPLAEGFGAMVVRTVEQSDAAIEKKREVLRALKDLELEHSVGKIDDDDYQEIALNYRNQAKQIMREMDIDIDPLRARAEDLARSYLLKRGLVAGEGAMRGSNGDVPAPGEPATVAESAPDAAQRRACRSCETTNEPDATFCKKCGARLEAPEENPDA